MSALTSEELQRYARHLSLPEFGIEGQRKLKQASVLIVGLGGLGSPVAMYLAAAGVGRLGLIDHDVVDISNLQRQVIHGQANLGQLKVESARARLADLNPLIRVDVHTQPFAVNNAHDVLQPYDLVVDGSDNFATRFLVNDACVLLGKPFVAASILRFEGQLSLFDARTGPCYRCLFPTPPPEHMIPNCAEGGVLGVLPGILGTLQANEAIKWVAGMGETLQGKLLLLDALRMQFRTLVFEKDPQCAICGAHPAITALEQTLPQCDIAPMPDHNADGCSVRMHAAELRTLLDDTASTTMILDVRQPHEFDANHIPRAILIPLDQLEHAAATMDRQQPIIVYCQSGRRSQTALALLHAQGFQRVRHLEGGFAAWQHASTH